DGMSFGKIVRTSLCIGPILPISDHLFIDGPSSRILESAAGKGQTVLQTDSPSFVHLLRSFLALDPLFIQCLEILKHSTVSRGSRPESRKWSETMIK
ncbi:hypothetical protein HAX54_035873, partial [Datura stramonium]|nr:hypothetical protein [Datura stramonium]